jgi:hypothetical protein
MILKLFLKNTRSFHKPKVHVHVYNSPSHLSLLSQLDPCHNLMPYFFEIKFNITASATLRQPVCPHICPGVSSKMFIYLKKAVPVTGRGSPRGCETSRIPHFLDSRLTDGAEVVRLRRRPPFTPQEDSWYSFLLEAESPWGRLSL